MFAALHKTFFAGNNQKLSHIVACIQADPIIAVSDADVFDRPTQLYFWSLFVNRQIQKT